MEQTRTKSRFPCFSTAAEKKKSTERPQFYKVNLSESKGGKQVQSCLN